jgi:hypothetical protein
MVWFRRGLTGTVDYESGSPTPPPGALRQSPRRYSRISSDSVAASTPTSTIRCSGYTTTAPAGLRSPRSSASPSDKPGALTRHAANRPVVSIISAPSTRLSARWESWYSDGAPTSEDSPSPSIPTRATAWLRLAPVPARCPKVTWLARTHGARRNSSGGRHHEASTYQDREAIYRAAKIRIRPYPVEPEADLPVSLAAGAGPMSVAEPGSGGARLIWPSLLSLEPSLC